MQEVFDDHTRSAKVFNNIIKRYFCASRHQDFPPGPYQDVEKAGGFWQKYGRVGSGARALVRKGEGEIAVTRYDTRPTVAVVPLVAQSTV